MPLGRTRHGLGGWEMGCRRWLLRAWGSRLGWGSRAAVLRNTEGLSVVAKVGTASRSCTPRATQNAPPAPPRLPCCPLPRS